MCPKKTSSCADGRPADDRGSKQANAAKDVLIENHGLLESYLRRRLRSPGDAEDYVQEVYCKVLAMDHEQRSKVRDWRGFLTRIASNLMTDQFRRDKTRFADLHIDVEEQFELLDDYAFDPERIVVSRDELAHLEARLTQLDDLGRRALIAARVHGQNHSEIAIELGISTKRVGYLIERTVRQLARQIAQESDR